MNVSPDEELPSPPPAAPSAYYVPPLAAYPPIYLSDPAMAAQYGYGVPFMNPPGMIPGMLNQFQDPKEIMSIIPTLRCWSCSKCGNLNYAHRLTCNLRKCQRMSSEAGEADWMCACGNMNYRFRKYCNLRKCQLPQIGNPYLFYGINQLIKSGYSSQTALSLLLTNGGASADVDRPVDTKEGCWQCSGCGNLNWPWRETCNKKGCNHPKTHSTL